MISKIAGVNDFQRIIKEKSMKSYVKPVAEKYKKVITDNNIDNLNSRQLPPKQPLDFYQQELLKSQTKKLLLLKK